MKNYAIIDFETRSSTPLNQGYLPYTEDPDFKVLCLGLKTSDHKNTHVYTHNLKLICDSLLRLSDIYPLIAFNAGFDAFILSKVVGRPYEEVVKSVLPLELLAKMVNSPDTLEESAVYFKLTKQKDMRGKEVMLQLALPQSDGSFINDKQLFKELYDYCRQDILVTERLYLKLKPLMPTLLKSPLLQNYYINILRNTKGIRYYVKGAKYLLKRSKELEDKYTKAAKALTKIPDFNLNSSQQFRAFLTDIGSPCRNTQKNTLNSVLRDTNSPIVRSMIKLKLNKPDGQKYTVFEKIINFTDSEGISRDSIRLYGAGKTGRYSSYGINILNLPKPSCTLKEIIKEKNLWKKHTYKAFPMIQGSTRNLLLPHRGEIFFYGDFSAIDMHNLLLASGDIKTYKKMLTGWDPYAYIASRAFNKVNVTKEERDTCKSVCLGIGYGLSEYGADADLKSQGKFLSTSRIKSIMTGYKKTFTKIEAYEEKLKTDFNCKYLRIPFSGRKLRFLDCTYIGKDNWRYKTPKSGYALLKGYQMVALTIQGLTVDCLHAAEIRVFEELKILPLIPWHDAIIASVDPKKANFEEFKKTMVKTPWFFNESIVPYLPCKFWKGSRYEE